MFRSDILLNAAFSITELQAKCLRLQYHYFAASFGQDLCLLKLDLCVL